MVRLVAGTADSDIGPQLSDLGIGYIWVTGATDDVTSRIDNTPGLGVASGNDQGTVWELDPAVSRAIIAGPDGISPVGALPATVPAGGEGRQLRIGEAADPRWQAELDGRRLEPADGGWQQAFSLPPEGGSLTYELPSIAGWLVAGQGAGAADRRHPGRSRSPSSRGARPHPIRPTRSDPVGDGVMAQLDHRPHRLRSRRIVVVSSAVVAMLLLGGAGAAMQPQNATVEPPRVAQIGRTTSICTVAEPEGGQQASQVPTTVVSGVTVRQEPGREGSLTGAALDTDKEELKVSQSGKGAQADGVRTSIVLSADGAMASTTSGSVLSTAPAGDDAGLAAAPCLTPATAHWFSGLGAEDADRTELILTNPDDTQAEVDLRFYGRLGRVVVPGSPGLTIDAHSSRTVSLSSVVKTQGALGLSVQTSQGRVTAVAKRLRTDNLKPAGVDWRAAVRGTECHGADPGGARR